MAEAGLQNPGIRIHRLGLTESGISDLQVGGDAWQLALDRATARYHPVDLFRARIDALQLAGLAVDWRLGTEREPAGDELSSVSSTNALLDLWPDQLHLRRATLSNSVLRLHGNGRTQSLALAAALTVTNNHTFLLGRLGGPDQAGAIQIEALVKKDDASRLTAEFQVINPIEWAALTSNAMPTSALPLTTSPWVGRLEATIPSGARVAALEGNLDPAALTFPGGRATLGETAAATSVGRSGLVSGMLRSSLELALDSGIELAVPTLSLGIENVRELTGRAEAVRLSIPGMLQAGGDLRLTTEDAFAGSDLQGKLGFELRALTLAGITLEPFSGELRGGADALAFDIPKLTLPDFGRWELTGITGAVRHPFAPDANLGARGYLTGRWPSNVVVDQALPFEIKAQRLGQQASGTFSLSLSNILLEAFSHGPPARLSGNLLVAADVSTNRSEFTTGFDLSLPRLTVGGESADDVTLSGEARLIRKADDHPPLPGLVLRFLPLLPGLTSDLLAGARADVRLQAARLRLASGLTLQEPRLHLVRLPATDAATGDWARIELAAEALTWQGFRIAPFQAVGSLDDDRFQLEGSGSLAGQSCPLRLELRSAGENAAAPVLAGHLVLGPLRLERFGIPDRWTGGDEVWISGEATVESPVRILTDGGRLEASPRLRLDLAKVEWPARKLTVEDVHTALSFISVNPPQSPSGELLTVDRVAYDAYALTDITLGVELKPDGHLQLQLVEAGVFDGTVRIAPFLWNLRNGDFSASAELERVDLQQLGRMIPRWDGELTGRLRGRVSVSRRNGQWRASGATFELDRSIAASLHYPAQGLLTDGMNPDSPRYEQLRLVETALENLALQAFSIDVGDPGTPATPARIHLEGTSVSSRAIVPIILNINFNGQFEELLQLFNAGGYEWSF
jgi:hypothetical protein